MFSFTTIPRETSCNIILSQNIKSSLSFIPPKQESYSWDDNDDSGGGDCDHCGTRGQRVAMVPLKF